VFIYNTSDFISPTTMSDVNKTKTNVGYLVTTLCNCVILCNYASTWIACYFRLITPINDRTYQDIKLFYRETKQQQSFFFW